MVANGPGCILGLDLHGTLLETGEVIRPELVEPVEAGLKRLKGRMARFICTGNDLEFVKRKIPAPILDEIDGCVLETGCSASLDNDTEEVLTTTDERELIQELETMLREADFKEVDYFAHRLTTISMFCDDPIKFYGKTDEYLRNTRFYDQVHITYSSVAVDILPRGYNKYEGLKSVARGKKTIGVADSMNDMALLAEADIALAPANIAPELVPVLVEKGRKIIPIGEVALVVPLAVIVASKKETRGVIEILEFLDKVIE